MKRDSKRKNLPKEKSVKVAPASNKIVRGVARGMGAAKKGGGYNVSPN